MVAGPGVVISATSLATEDTHATVEAPARIGMGVRGSGDRPGFGAKMAYSVRVNDLSRAGVADAPPVVPDDVVGDPVAPDPVEPAPSAVLAEPGVTFAGEITHYGESFNGQSMGCPGAGLYWSNDPTIAAVPWPSRGSEWPCGTRFTVTGPAGSVEVIRTDACPGCGYYGLDLSESGMLQACGYLGRCQVTITVH